MPAIASLEDLKAAQKPLRYALCLPAVGTALFDMGDYVPLAPHDLRLRMTLCPMRSALCGMLAMGSRTIER